MTSCGYLTLVELLDRGEDLTANPFHRSDENGPASDAEHLRLQCVGFVAPAINGSSGKRVEWPRGARVEMCYVIAFEVSSSVA